MFTYPPEFLESLESFGLAPTSATPPDVTRGALNDLYRHELRTLRSRLLAGDVPQAQYHDHVVALRKKYWLLTLPLPAWERICAGLPPAPVSRVARDPSGDPS